MGSRPRSTSSYGRQIAAKFADLIDTRQPHLTVRNGSCPACLIYGIGLGPGVPPTTVRGWFADIYNDGSLATPDSMLRSGIFVMGAIALSGCSDGCANKLISRADAPNGLHGAVMFQRNCGATAGFTTQISVVEPGGEPSDGGNAFRADGDHGAAAGAWGGPWAEMRWLAPDHLLIRYAANSRLFAREGEVSGVRISYQQVTR